MLRTAARALAAATLVAALLVPAVPAAAAPSTDGGWIVALFDAVAGWLAPFGRVAASDPGEALPGLHPGGPAAAAAQAEKLPDLDPGDLTAEPYGPQSQTTGDDGEAYPNLDPDG